tara:strand:- start:282 stop:656 length:375 start_codon:yes stop_codon:yes gene_type:complete
MKSRKLSWYSFLIVLLIIVLLGCLIYYLEQNKILENYSNYNNNFNNLTFASVSSEGDNPDYVNPLNSYKQNTCGSVNVNNFFKDLKFKPECCNKPNGSNYSNTQGCACMCPEQWKYLNSRGGNK